MSIPRMSIPRMIVPRSIAFNIFYFGSTALLMIPGLFIRLFCPHRALGLAIFWARMELAAVRIICGIRLSVSGQEHLPRTGSALIASRHESAFDTMVWLTLLPRACYVLKSELTRIPFFGGMVRASGMIPVDRDGGATAMRQLMRDGIRAVAEGRQIVIFPEGTRGESGTLLTLHPGVAALAFSTKLPIIPVVTDSGRLWGRRSFRKFPGTIVIRILPPLASNLRRPELMHRLETALREGLADIGSGRPL